MNLSGSLLAALGMCMISAPCFAADTPTAPAAPPMAITTTPKADELAAKWYDTTGTLIEAISSGPKLQLGRFEEPQRQVAALLSEGARTPGFTARFIADSPRALLRFGLLSPVPEQVEQATKEIDRQRSFYIMAQNDVLIEQNRQIIALLTQIAAKDK